MGFAGLRVPNPNCLDQKRPLLGNFRAVGRPGNINSHLPHSLGELPKKNEFVVWASQILHIDGPNPEERIR